MLHSKLQVPGLHKNARQRGMNEFAFIKSCLSQQTVLGDSGVVFFFNSAYQHTKTCVLGKLGTHACSGRMLVWLSNVIPLQLVQRKHWIAGWCREGITSIFIPTSQTKTFRTGIPLPDSGEVRAGAYSSSRLPMECGSRIPKSHRHRCHMNLFGISYIPGPLWVNETASDQEVWEQLPFLPLQLNIIKNNQI